MHIDARLNPTTGREEIVYDERTYIEQLTNNPMNQIYIMSGGSTTETIQGFVDVEMSFGGTSSYNAETLGKGAADNANKTMASVESWMGPDAAREGNRVNSVKLSRQSWQSSSLNTLSFDLFIVATKDGDNPMADGNKIWDYLLPREISGLLMQTPGDYLVSQWGNQENAVSIVIGDWFRSYESWLMSTGIITVSKQKAPDGVTPLYVKMSITLTQCRDFFAEEVKSWFITG